MQKVEGSNPFSRFEKPCKSATFAKEWSARTRCREHRFRVQNDRALAVGFEQPRQLDRNLCFRVACPG